MYVLVQYAYIINTTNHILFLNIKNPKQILQRLGNKIVISITFAKSQG